MFSPARSLANLDCNVCIDLSTKAFLDLSNLFSLIYSISFCASGSSALA